MKKKYVTPHVEALAVERNYRLLSESVTGSFNVLKHEEKETSNFTFVLGTHDGYATVLDENTGDYGSWTLEEL